MDIVRRFKGLDNKSSDFVRKMAEKRRKALQIGFFDYLFVCKDWYASSDELFCGGWVQMVAMLVAARATDHIAKFIRQKTSIVRQFAPKFKHEDLVCGLQDEAVPRRACIYASYLSHYLSLSTISDIYQSH